MRGKQLTEAVKSMRNDGFTVVQTAEALKISTTSVYRIYAKLDLVPCTNERNRSYSPEKVVSLWDTGCSISEISDRIGVDPSTVYRTLDRRGIELDGRDWSDFQQREFDFRIPSDSWLVEFRGLFYGEGCVSISKREPPRKSYSAAMIMSLRSDDEAVLSQFRDVFGGTLNHIEHPSTSGDYIGNPQTRWVVSGWTRSKAIVEVSNLMDGLIPARKKQEIGIFYAACLARFRMKHKLTDADREVLHSYYLALKAFKRFQL